MSQVEAEHEGTPSYRQSLFDNDPVFIKTMDRFAAEMNKGGLKELISKNLRGSPPQKEILLRPLHVSTDKKVQGDFQKLQDGTVIGVDGQDGFVLSVRMTPEREHALGIVGIIDSRNLPNFPDAVVPEPPSLFPAFPIIAQVQGPADWWYTDSSRHIKEKVREVMAQFRWTQVLAESTERWAEEAGFERIGILAARCLRTDVPVNFAYLSSRFDGLAVTRKYDSLDFLGVHTRNFPTARQEAPVGL